MVPPFSIFNLGLPSLFQISHSKSNIILQKIFQLLYKNYIFPIISTFFGKIPFYYDIFCIL